MKDIIFVLLLILLFSGLIICSASSDNNGQESPLGAISIKVNGTEDAAKIYPDIKDVNKHLLSTAFSEYNGILQRKESNKTITVCIFGAYTADDIQLTEEFLNHFNEVSQTLKFNKNVKKEGEGDLWINILPEKALAALPEEQMDITVHEGLFGQTLYRVNLSNQVYVNSDLPSMKREHNLIRALLFWLGMTGNSVDPSSIFSPENDDQIGLSIIDWKALTSLYNPSLKRGMTVSDAKTRLYTT